MRKREKALRFSLVIVSLGLTFLVIEIYLRLFLPQDLIKPMAAQLDQEIIYTLKPNFEAYLKGTSSRKFHLKTNSLGIREQEIPFDKPKDIFRILLLGDSVSMAEGVELNQIYLKQLESILKANQIKSVDTVNAAIRGYGNDQELILFRRLGKKYNPDLVILAFYTGNDINDNQNGQLFELQGENLVQRLATVETSKKYKYYSIQSMFQNMPGYSFLMSHSHLANLIRVSYFKIITHRIYKEEKLKDIPLEEQPAFHLTLAILRQLNQDVQEFGARSFILIIPTFDDIRALRTEPLADIDRVDLALENFCQINEIPFLNLSHDMIRWQGDFESLWLSCGHLSPDGHAWVAQELFDALRSKELLPAL